MAKILRLKFYLILRCLIGTTKEYIRTLLAKFYLILRCLIGTRAPAAPARLTKFYLILRCKTSVANKRIYLSPTKKPLVTKRLLKWWTGQDLNL